MGESAEDLLLADPAVSKVERFGWPGAILSRSELGEGTVRPRCVVVPQVLVQHPAQMAPIDDQQLVKELPAQGPDHPLADDVRSGRLRRASENPDSAYVNFSASGMPLVRLAELFDDLFPRHILMPVSKMQEKVTTDEELCQIKLGNLGEYLGPAPVRTPLPGRATPPTDAEV